MKNIMLLFLACFQFLSVASAVENNEGRSFDIALNRGPAGDWPKESCVEAVHVDKKIYIENSSKNYVLDKLILEKLMKVLEGGGGSSQSLSKIFVYYPGFGRSIFMDGDRSVCKN